MPSLPFNSDFRPAWWCANPHLQTLWPYLFRLNPRPRYRRERLELDDGDFLDVDWHGPATAPIVVILHGLGGCSHSHYVRGLVSELGDAGLRSAVLHHRGCSGEPNRLPRSYHAGDGGDLGALLARIGGREPQVPLFAVGYSLGASMLFHWLTRRKPGLVAAASISPPFELAKGADRMQRGLSRLYQRHLVGSMKRLVRLKASVRAMPIDLKRLSAVHSFRQFDDLVTAPLHGFADAEDYYARCSARRLLSEVDTPTLILHAQDDPLTTPDAVPGPDELSPAVTFELSRHGGHCGFVSGSGLYRPVYWAERRASRFILSFLERSDKTRR